MRIEQNTLTAADFLDLYCSVGWEAPLLSQVEKALANTVATFTAYDGNKPVGMVRLLGDCGMSYYIKDFAIKPAYQRHGIGKKLMTHVESYIKDHLEDGWAVSLELISSKGFEGFYKKMRFEERPCEWDGPGMFKMVR